MCRQRRQRQLPVKSARLTFPLYIMHAASSWQMRGTFVCIFLVETDNQLSIKGSVLAV